MERNKRDYRCGRGFPILARDWEIFEHALEQVLAFEYLFVWNSFPQTTHIRVSLSIPDTLLHCALQLLEQNLELPCFNRSHWYSFPQYSQVFVTVSPQCAPIVFSYCSRCHAIPSLDLCHRMAFGRTFSFRFSLIWSLSLAAMCSLWCSLLCLHSKFESWLFSLFLSMWWMSQPSGTGPLACSHT